MRSLLYMDDSWMLPCMSKQLTGMDCPGCGIQRSISFLLHGEFIDAFYMYPGIYPMILLFLFLIFDWFKDVKHGEKIKIALVIATIATIVTNYVINILTI